MNDVNRQWDVFRLDNPRLGIDVQPGFACGKKDTDGGIPHLRMNNISSSGLSDFALVRRIPLKIAEEKGRWLEPGDILFCNTNSTDLVGKSAIFRGWSELCTFSNHLTRIRVESQSLTPEWLFFCLRRLWFKRYFAVHCTEFIGQSSFDKKKLKEIEIPVPPVEVQCRIVSGIDAVSRRIEEAQNIAAERECKLEALLQSLYGRLIEGVEWKPLRQVASLTRRPVKTKPDEQYEEMGIRSFGKGTFKKPVLTGKQVGNKRIYTIHKGDLVFNNVFAWEKAIAVAKDVDHGRVGSHRFITYVAHEGQATAEFLCHHFLSERGIEDIRAASPGSAGRNRTLGLKKLERILVPVPGYDKQQRFSEIAKRRQLIQSEASSIEAEIKGFIPALLDRAFRGEL